MWPWAARTGSCEVTQDAEKASLTWGEAISSQNSLPVMEVRSRVPCPQGSITSPDCSTDWGLFKYLSLWETFVIQTTTMAIYKRGTLIGPAIQMSIFKRTCKDSGVLQTGLLPLQFVTYRDT